MRQGQDIFKNQRGQKNNYLHYGVGEPGDFVWHAFGFYHVGTC